MSTKVAINGFGRIGRAFLRLAASRPDLEVVAINDLTDLDTLAYLLQYDSVYGRAPFQVEVKDGMLLVDGRTIQFLQEREPGDLPWAKLDVDIVVEATGFFTTYAASKAHLDAGAKRVVLTAPAKDAPEDAGVAGATVLLGVNEADLKEAVITTNASCTTNAANPLIAILKETVGVEKALLNTVHGYTSSQGLVDGPNKKNMRAGRAAAINIVPSTTGAAIATTKAHPELVGKFNGMALRVPVVSGSIVDVTFLASRETSVEEVNQILAAAAKTNRWQHIFAVTNDPLVSTDIIGARYGAIADLSFTQVADNNLVKVLAWYDNEMGYTHTLVEHVLLAGKALGDPEGFVKEVAELKK